MTALCSTPSVRPPARMTTIAAKPSPAVDCRWSAAGRLQKPEYHSDLFARRKSHGGDGAASAHSASLDNLAAPSAWS